MRERIVSKGLENGADAKTSDDGDPGYPDRARIDSDVRAFLREPSTPWIVFDRDSKVDDFAKSALRLGAVFMSSPDFRPEVLKAAAESGRSLEDVVAKPLPGLLPPPPPAQAIAAPKATVAPFVSEDTASLTTEPGLSVALALTTPPPAPKRGRGAAVLAACAGFIAVFGVAGLASKTGLLPVAEESSIARANTANIAAATTVEAAVTDTVELPPVVELPDDAPVKAASPKTDSKKRFGTLTIRGEARHKNVYFDGKRMLGTGRRSFLVACGTHTIAVTDKADVADIEVPCDGEYAVSR